MALKDTHADAKWRLACKKRDGYRCRFRDCGRRWGLEVHHVFSRGYGATKTDPDNGVTLCAEHHAWAQQHMVRFQGWWMEVIGPERFDELRRKALSCNGKLVPRPLPDPEQTWLPSAPVEEVLEQTSPREDLIRAGSKDPSGPAGLAMALLTVDKLDSDEGAALWEEVVGLQPGDWSALMVCVVSVGRMSIDMLPDPDSFRQYVGAQLQSVAAR